MTDTPDPNGTELPDRKVFLPIGQRLQNWTVVSHIADGGHSSVYHARYSGLRVDENPAEAALKITPIPGPAYAARLVDEYRKARQVTDNPYIVTGHDAFETRRPDVGSCVVLIHDLGQESLADRIRNDGPLDQSSIKKLASDLVRGMSALHNENIIHSDIKPANILRFSTGWKLADLGTAAVMKPLETTDSETGASVIGATLLYSTPELAAALINGEEAPRLRRHADIWAFGLVLHEAASGRRVFQQQLDVANDNRDIDQSLPRNLKAIIEICLVADKDSRLGSTNQLRQFLIVQDLWEEEEEKEAVSVKTEPRPTPPEPVPTPVKKESEQRKWPYPITKLHGSITRNRPQSNAQTTPAPAPGPNRGVIAAVVAALLFFAGCGVLLTSPFSGDGGETGSGTGSGTGTGSGSGTGGDSGETTLGPAACSGDDDDDRLSIRFVGSGLAFEDVRSQAVQVAVSEVMAVTESDEGSDLSPEVVLSETNFDGETVLAELTDGCVDALVTNLASSNSINILPEVTGAGVIQFSVNATSPLLSDIEDNGLFFRTAPSDEIQGRLLATRLRANDLDKTRAAVIYLNDDYGSALKDEFERSFEGGEQLPRVIAEYAFDSGSPIDAAEIEGLVDEEPDAIVVIGFQDDSAQVLRLLAEQEYEFDSESQSVWLVDGNAGVAESLGDEASLAAGIHQTVPGAEATGDALDSLRERLGLSSGEQLASYTAQSYDAVIILALAAAVARSGEASEIADEINRITEGGEKCSSYEGCLQLLDSGTNVDYDGVGGRYEFTDEGEPFEAIYRIDTLGADGKADSQQSQLTRETLCEICEANDPELQITFSDGSSSVAEFEEELKKIAEIITESRVGHVLVEGYASRTGSSENNKLLAQARATEVHDRLVELGVPDGKITEVGGGEEDRFLDNRTVLFAER